MRIWDLDGRDYLNCRSSGGVFNFGHHPGFAVEALATAVREHDMGDWLLPSLRRVEAHFADDPFFHPSSFAARSSARA